MIKDEKTAGFFRNTFNSPDYNYFIGLQYDGDSYKWIDGSPLTYSNWEKEPTGQHHCGALLPQSHKQWYESSCAAGRRFLCQV